MLGETLTVSAERDVAPPGVEFTVPAEVEVVQLAAAVCSRLPSRVIVSAVFV